MNGYDPYDPRTAREYALTEQFYTEQRHQRMMRIESDRREYRERQLRDSAHKKRAAEIDQMHRKVHRQGESDC